MNHVEQVKYELSKYTDPEQAESFSRFFKMEPGEYGEGDEFIGITVPNQRKVARKYYKTIPLEAVVTLLRDPVHEYRSTALFILVYKFKKLKTDVDRKKIVDIYLDNLPYINNWDLVDSSAHHILGAYLFDKDKGILYQLARSGDLWQQRIAIISTLYFIRNRQFQPTLEIAELLLQHEHDLIHKAVGWMLREIGKRDFAAEFNFLKNNYQKMPRTMLRYAIEKFDPDLRQKFLKGLI